MEHPDAARRAVALAQAFGIAVEEPLVLRAGLNVVVHLAPAPVVARVWPRLAWPWSPSSEEQRRELAVTAHAAASGAPVVPPSGELPPGPHELDGLTITFWTYADPGTLEPAEAGRRLREVHEALADFEGELPAPGHATAVRALLESLPPSGEVDVLLDGLSEQLPYLVGDQVREDVVQWQALHGDAHLGNCLGGLWTDFEWTARGPVEADLASLVARDRLHGGYPPALEALAAYGPYEEDLLEAYLPVQAVFLTAWRYATVERPDRLLDERLAWLRVRDRSWAACRRRARGLM